MKIIINGQPLEVEAKRLDQAMTELGFAEQRVATALNGEFVPQRDWPKTALSAGDALEVLAPMQGG
ncbi:sulfur carrier protein ThiS [Maritalea porphyrae]|uniref:sulfur carrier protein ThiS n=1 Tax=Maritalea porphyrae TaxID=880732 RepID=UPI0022B07D5C|nr:sulfur carrier protein ThiS [Maritalea porphyrae]MCZ4272387.1 sulfur carrier protein ThiS [Maritalea porphyrae]